MQHYPKRGIHELAYRGNQKTLHSGMRTDDGNAKVLAFEVSRRPGPFGFRCDFLNTLRAGTTNDSTGTLSHPSTAAQTILPSTDCKRTCYFGSMRKRMGSGDPPGLQNRRLSGSTWQGCVRLAHASAIFTVGCGDSWLATVRLLRLGIGWNQDAFRLRFSPLRRQTL